MPYINFYKCICIFRAGSNQNVFIYGYAIHRLDVRKVLYNSYVDFWIIAYPDVHFLWTAVLLRQHLKMMIGPPVANHHFV